MKKTFILGGAAALSLAAAVGVATAQQGPGQHRGPDADNDGRISRAEFVDGRIARLTALDTNRDGTVSAEEAQAGRQAQRAERQAAMFDRLDANRDGSISRAEFTNRPERDGPRAERAGHRMGGHHGRGGPGRHGGMGGGPNGRMGGERGPVVISEVSAKLTEQFAKADTDRDGYLSQAERQASRAEMREHRQERRAAHRAARQAQQPASPSTAPSE